MTTALTLFASPGACSRVPLILLEQAQADYQINWVQLAKGEHKRPEYLALNPKGKVPALNADGQILSENPAIIRYLHQQFPQANLQPSADTVLDDMQQLADLCFCSATLHPLVTRFCRPDLLTLSDDLDSIKFKAQIVLSEALQLPEQRYSEHQWWYGEAWSAMDAYIFWVVSRLQNAGFILSDLPNLQSVIDAMLLRPAVQQALAKEQQLV